MRAKEHKPEAEAGRAEGEGEADSLLSRESDVGLDPKNLGSGPGKTLND